MNKKQQPYLAIFVNVVSVKDVVAAIARAVAFGGVSNYMKKAAGSFCVYCVLLLLCWWYW